MGPIFPFLIQNEERTRNPVLSRKLSPRFSHEFAKMSGLDHGPSGPPVADEVLANHRGRCINEFLDQVAQMSLAEDDEEIVLYAFCLARSRLGQNDSTSIWSRILLLRREAWVMNRREQSLPDVLLKLGGQQQKLRHIIFLEGNIHGAATLSPRGHFGAPAFPTDGLAQKRTFLLSLDICGRYLGKAIRRL
jgi:hypothetical protein